MLAAVLATPPRITAGKPTPAASSARQIGDDARRRLGDRLRRRRLRGLDAHARGGQLARRRLDDGGLDAAPANVDADHLHVRSPRSLAGPVARPDRTLRGQAAFRSGARLTDWRHAARNDRPRAHGRQHRAAPDARRPRVRRLRRQRGGDRAARGRGRDRRALARGVRGQADARRARPGSWCPRRSRARPSTSSRRYFERGDIVIDGGNSYYRDDIDRAAGARAERGIHYVDVGTSGGVFGLERGYCMMIGGEDAHRRSTSTRSSARSRRASRWRARTPGRRGPAGAVGARLPALRRARRGALREDGPQRHRVRDDGRLRRGPRDPQEGRHRPPRARQGRRDDAPARPRSTTSTRSTCPRSPRSGGAAA